MTAFSDPLADMLTRIRNGQQAKLAYVHSPSSKLRLMVLDVLKNEGYIRDFAEAELRTGIKEIKIELKYNNGVPVINKIEKVSKPGRRVYTNLDKFRQYYNGLGVSILSTSKGVMSDYDANVAKVGGEILCRVF